MKKLLALAALVLGLASCQTEPEGVDVVMGGEVDATIRVEIPEAETRAMDSAQGIFGTDILSGAPTMRYILEIYHNGELAKERQVLYSDGKTMAFPVRLVPGRAYDFVVWADVVTAENAGDNHYVTENGLTNITLNGEWNAMDETRDAFTGVMSVAQFSNSTNITFDLTRPFAKLRIRTTDIKDVMKLGITPTTATVEYTTDHRQSFNARTKEYGNADLDKTQEVDYRVVSYEDVTTASTYTLFADYFFADNDIVNFTLEVKDAASQTIGEKITFNTPINVRRNYLTTISGNLLTDANNVNVEIKPGFGDNDENLENFTYITTAAELLAAMTGNGQFILGNDITLTGPAAGTLAATRSTATTSVINLNGFTITIKNTGSTALVTIEEGNSLVFEGEGTIVMDPESTGAFIENKGNVEIGVPTEDNSTNADIVNNSGEGEYVDHVALLVAAFENGGEHTLEANVTIADALTLAAGKTLTLDLNGFAISHKMECTESYNMITNRGTLTIKGEGRISLTDTSAGGGSTWGSYTIYNYGTLEVNDATIEHLGSTGDWGDNRPTDIPIQNYAGKVTINSGVISSPMFRSLRDFTAGGEIIINGGKFQGQVWMQGLGTGSSSLTINGGEFAPTAGYDGSSVYITNGTNDIAVTINGGLFNTRIGCQNTNKDGVKDAIHGGTFKDVSALNLLAAGADITLDMSNYETLETITIPAGTTVTMDLAGNTITGVDETTKNYGLVQNNGTLLVKNGTLKLSATNNNGWDRYSAVISNNPGATLTVAEDVVLEHLGGTDMAYGIDILTNGGIGDVKATISGTVKSTYRAVRQFLNSDSKNNELVITAGARIEGQNYGVFFHDPSAKANNGSLTIEEGAEVSGVYLYVTENSTEWPVNVSINAEAIGEKQVVWKNVPAGYGVILEDGVYKVVKNGVNNYVLVSNVDELKALASNAGEFRGKKVFLLADIDLNNEEWAPIGNSSTAFQGTFDGQNHTISNLTITGDNSNVGLFGFTTNGEIRNLVVENAKVSGRLNVGVVAGNPYTSKYTNITVQGHVEVNGMAYVGGVGGKNAYANWTNVTVNVDETSYVKANSIEDGTAYRTYVGGACGFNGEGGHTFTNITSNINVEGTTCDVGGLFGIAHYGNRFVNCSCSGNIEITDAAEAADAEEMGGIAGVWHNQDGYSVTFTNCSFTGTLKANITDGLDLSDNTIVGAAYSSTGTGTLVIE